MQGTLRATSSVFQAALYAKDKDLGVAPAPRISSDLVHPPQQPSTDDDSLGRPHPARRSEAQLVVALECERPLAGSARFSLSGIQEVRIGRGDVRSASRVTEHGYTTLDLRLPSRFLSSTHARIVRAHGEYLLEDAQSRNGSFVDGQRVTRAVIRDGQVADVGHVLLLLREAMDMREAPSDLEGEDLRGESQGFRTLVPQIAEEFAALKRLTTTRVPILILGDTGTGKEAIARGIHALSGRRGAMIPINCGALPASLVEAHLFGHVKGAFSGATRDELGFLRSAHEGTLFLDEVGELPRPAQTTLLRVLQDGEVTPVGSTRATNVDVRVVSATCRELVSAESNFRPDLFGRLAGRTLRLPPLRERIEDIGLALAEILTTQAPGGGERITLSPEVGRLFLTHSWPLNFRELQQSVCAALPLADNGVLDVRHFPGLSQKEAPAHPEEGEAAPAGAMQPRDEDDRLRIVVIANLRLHQGNVTAVARTMGKAPMQIHRWMKKFGIDPRGFRKT